MCYNSALQLGCVDQKCSLRQSSIAGAEIKANVSTENGVEKNSGWSLGFGALIPVPENNMTVFK